MADWLQQSKLTAVDQSAAMIAALWIGDSNNRQAVEGDWFSPPIAPGTQDVVLGDGVLNFFTIRSNTSNLQTVWLACCGTTAI